MYFVGQYAAPVTCLQEMKTWNIAGVNLETMASEANRFYEIVSQLMRNAVPEKAQYCEFIYYDGRHCIINSKYCIRFVLSYGII